MLAASSQVLVVGVIIPNAHKAVLLRELVCRRLTRLMFRSRSGLQSRGDGPHVGAPVSGGPQPGPLNGPDRRRSRHSAQTDKLISGRSAGGPDVDCQRRLVRSATIVAATDTWLVRPAQAGPPNLLLRFPAAPSALRQPSLVRAAERPAMIDPDLKG